MLQFKQECKFLLRYLPLCYDSYKQLSNNQFRIFKNT